MSNLIYKRYLTSSQQLAWRTIMSHRVYFSDHLLREILPIWDHYTTETMVITRDLLEAELSLQYRDLEELLKVTSKFCWVHSVLTPPAGIELRMIEVPGVLGWGFIEGPGSV